MHKFLLALTYYAYSKDKSMNPFLVNLQREWRDAVND